MRAFRLGLTSRGQNWRYRTFIGDQGRQESIDYNLDGYILDHMVPPLERDQPVIRGFSWDLQATDANKTACAMSPDTIVRTAYHHLEQQGFQKLAVISAHTPAHQALYHAFLSFVKKHPDTTITCQEFLSGTKTTDKKLIAFSHRP